MSGSAAAAAAAGAGHHTTGIANGTDYTMPDHLHDDLRHYITQHSDILVPSAYNKIRCTVTHTDLPYDLSAIRNHLHGRRYRQCCNAQLKQTDKYKQLINTYKQHITPHAKSEHKLYCTLTRTVLNNQYTEVLHHINGRHFQTRLTQYNRRQQLKQQRKNERNAGRAAGAAIDGAGSSSAGSDAESSAVSSMAATGGMAADNDDVWSRAPAQLYDSEFVSTQPVQNQHPSAASKLSQRPRRFNRDSGSDSDDIDDVTLRAEQYNDMVELGIIDANSDDERHQQRRHQHRQPRHQPTHTTAPPHRPHTDQRTPIINHSSTRKQHGTQYSKKPNNRAAVVASNTHRHRSALSEFADGTGS